MIEFSESALMRYLDRLESLEENPPADRHRTEIFQFLQDFQEIAAQLQMPPDRQNRLASRILQRLYIALLGTEDQELRAFYFNGLAVFGLQSLPFFSAYLHRTLKNELPVADVLDEYPPLIRALVINNILLDPLGAPREFVQAAKKRLQLFTGFKPREALQFLLTLAQGEESLAFATQDMLRSGSFWKFATSRLNEPAKAQEDPDAPAASDIIECLALFDAPELTELFTSYLLRHGANPPKSLLKSLSRTARPDDLKVFKAISKLLLHAEKDIQEEALRTLAVISPKDVGRIYTAVYKKNAQLKPLLVMLLPLMPAEETKTFLSALTERQIRKVYSETFSAWTILDPQKSLTCLKSAADTGGHDPKTLETLLAHLPKPNQAPVHASSLKAAGKKAPATTGWEKNTGEASCAHNDGDIAARKRKLADVNFSGRTVSDIHLENAEISHGDFSQSAIQGAVFKNVSFVRTNFSRAIIKDAFFVNCQFTRCSFEEAELFDSLFEDTTCDLCCFEGAAFSKCTLVKAQANETMFTGAALHDSHLLTSRFACCELSRMLVENGSIKGVEFIRSNLHGVFLQGITLESCLLTGSLLGRARACGIITDSPEILRLYRKGLLESAACAKPSAPPEFGKKEEALVRDALMHWQILRQATFRKYLFMRNNKRRIDWSNEKLGEEKAQFIKLAPYLMHTEVFEHVQDLPLLPLACCVAHYQPDLSTLEIAGDYFNRIELPEHAHDPVQIHGIYLIGSVGSVAQTPSSDLDFWVCYDAADMPEFMADGLAYKLEVIEQWAMDVFGLEVHFFLMDVNLIRNNQFGFSDAESSGSAQALLLKEEFYRTAVHVAGRLPVWCVTEPGEKRNEHQKALDALLASGALSGLIDLGGLQSIPREEFFGASLWQIVKALKSPFKSIMKFGLLERYIASSDGGHSLLLCDKLKSNLFAGQAGLSQVDPYVMLFKEVVEHYLARGDKDSMQMVRMSFALKTALRNQMLRSGPYLRSESKEIKEIFADSPQNSPMHLSSFYITQDWPFDKLVSMGHMVNKFVIRTYSRVREEQSGLEKVAITPEDLTKLGRKIFSTFSKRKNKIEHIPFVSFSEVPFKVLHFSATGGKIGEPERWDIQGAQEVSTSQRLHLADLRSGESLPELLAWLTANEMYAPGMLIRGDYSISPVTTRDLGMALSRLRAFFPASKTFNTDIAETLNPERVVRAFFLLNLVKPRETSDIRDVSIIYSTNWGELFCITVAAAAHTIRKDPMEFLRANTLQSVPEPPVMDSFVPTRSNCRPLEFKAAS